MKSMSQDCISEEFYILQVWPRISISTMLSHWRGAHSKNDPGTNIILYLQGNLVELSANDVPHSRPEPNTVITTKYIIFSMQSSK